MTHLLDSYQDFYTTVPDVYIFKGCVKGANASASIYSLIETAKSCGLNPYDYLKDIFIRLPQKISSGESLDDLLPYNWKPQVL